MSDPLRRLLPGAVTPLRRIPILVLQPSTDLGELVTQPLERLPYLLRHLFRGLGVRGKTGSDLLSYLAFDGEYTSRLVALVETDARARADEIATFLGLAGSARQPSSDVRSAMGATGGARMNRRSRIPAWTPRAARRWRLRPVASPRTSRRRQEAPRARAGSFWPRAPAAARAGASGSRRWARSCATRREKPSLRP
jgi:hypothetical protein